MQIVGTCLVVGMGIACLSSDAFASGPTVSIPAGRFSDGQTITVAGTGFPGHAADPSGVQILQCADPMGLPANLPVDASTCEGTTISPLPVNTDTQGRFSTPYVLSTLTTRGGRSSIVCDASNYCVLWVGVDYNQQFTSGPHAFSRPFEISPAATSSSGTTSTSTPGSPSSTTPSASAGSQPGSPAVGATATTGADNAAAAGSPASGVAAGQSDAASATGSLAYTGSSAALPWFLGSGSILMAVGTVGRRRVRPRLVTGDRR
jgi:hypothetical protein